MCIRDRGDWDGPGPAAQLLAVGASVTPSFPHRYEDLPYRLVPTVFLHLIHSDGSVLKTVKIDQDTPQMPAGKPRPNAQFGRALTYLAEPHGPGVLAVVASEGGKYSGLNDQGGELYLMRLNRDLSIDELKVINFETPGAPPVFGTREQRTAFWYFGPVIDSFQPLLQDNQRGIAYLLAALAYTQEGYTYRIFGLHDDLSIATYATLDDNSLAPINYGAYGEIIYVDGLAYLGMLDPDRPDLHAIGVTGQIFTGAAFTQALLVHQVHIPQQ